MMPGRSPETPARRVDSGGLSAHILPTSATMIGVCLTALYISLLGPPSEGRVPGPVHPVFPSANGLKTAPI